MIVYVYEGKTYVVYEDTTLEVKESKDYVERNKQKFIDRINNIKGEIDNG